MHRFFIFCLSFSLLAIGLNSRTLSAASYRSPLADVQWFQAFSDYRCELRQPLGVWGDAGFVRQADGSDAFFLRFAKGAPLTGAVRVHAVAPAWRQASETLLGDLYLDQHSTGKGSVVAQMRTALERHQRIWLQPSVVMQGEAPVSVILEPMHFAAAMAGWQQCVAGLKPGYEQLRRTTIFFPEADAALATNELNKLKNIARWLRQDRSITGIYIDGHTDNIGNTADNLQLSRKRAQWVAGYLAEQGVPRRRLLVRWHGEKYPVVANFDASGRDRNRRVTVRLERETAVP
jgi:outer membrane protein OmpA-like peptidoglycan-associated protein